MDANHSLKDTIKVVIVDDDLPSVEVLRNTLESFPDVEVCECASNITDGRRAIISHKPDLVFLDIEFPDSSGLDIFDNLKGLPATRFVFYTLYSKYFHQALKLRAFDYLLKPFDPEEVRLILDRYRLAGRLPGLTASDVCQSLPMRPELQPIAITTITNDKVIVPPGGILFFKYDSERKIWEVILSTLQRYILKRHTTAELILSYGNDFVRTHKAYIINISYLALISGNECRLLPPFDNITEIKISKNYKRQLLDRFYDI